MWYYIGMIAALAIGIYIGLGAPGFPGKEDRVVSHRSDRSREGRRFTPIDLLRPKKREGEQRFLSKRD